MEDAGKWANREGEERSHFLVLQLNHWLKLRLGLKLGRGAYVRETNVLHSLACGPLCEDGSGAGGQPSIRVGSLAAGRLNRRTAD